MTSQILNMSSTKRSDGRFVERLRGGSPYPPRSMVFLRGGCGEPPRKIYVGPLTLGAGGTTSWRAGVGRRAFTLVELITVMAIMAILVAMIVGVAPRIQDAWRARITQTRLLAIVAALQAYAEDYNGKFPYSTQIMDTDGKIILVKVDDPAILGISLTDVPSEYQEEVILYGALTSARRRGPYYKAAGGQTVVRKEGTKEFTLFADGWERPIRYEYEGTAKQLTVRSLGKDGTDKTGDDIVCYVFENTN